MNLLKELLKKSSSPFLIFSLSVIVAGVTTVTSPPIAEPVSQSPSSMVDNLSESTIATPSDTSSPIVISIEIRGAKRITESAVRAKITHKVNEPVTSEKINHDIKEIYKMGYFDDVKVEMEPVSGGVKLIYVLKEKPTIQRINFEGNKEFDDQKLRETISITHGSIADATLIQDNASRIKALYEEKGYYLSNVIPVIRQLREDTVSLTYMIDEGPVVKIKKLSLKEQTG